MLTAQELVQLRVKVDKTLPTKGSKEFRPSHSWLEKKQIQSALDERKALLEEERVEKLGSLAKAEWDPQQNIAVVTCRIGRQWKHMGHEVAGKLRLFPEEALFLLECNNLELLYSGVAMSIQQAYCTLLGPDTGCTFNEYTTYVHLVRQGYTVLRHSRSIRATRYERQIRLDQHTLGQKQQKSKQGTTVQEIVIEDENRDTVSDVKTFSTQATISVKAESNETDTKPFLIKNNGLHENGSTFVQTDIKHTVNNSSQHVESICKNITPKVEPEIKNEPLPENHDVIACPESQSESSRSKTEPTSDSEDTASSVEVGVVPTKSEPSYSTKDTTVEHHKKSSQSDLNIENFEWETSKGNKVITSVIEKSTCPIVEKTKTAPAKIEADQRKNSVECSDSAVESLPTTSKETSDVIIVDDSSTSMDASEKHRSKREGISSSINVMMEENLTVQKIEEMDTDVVDLSDSSMMSDVDSNFINSNSKQKGRTVEEIEIVDIIDDKKDTDEILEVKCNRDSSSPVKSRRRKFYPNHMEYKVADNSTHNSGFQNHSLHAENMSRNRRKVTNVELNHEEIKIMPNIVDAADNRVSMNSSENEIEVVDLEDEEEKENVSWEEERRKILDSIPNIEGKYVMHVKIPDRSLLPPNVSPQHEDYYIHRYNASDVNANGRSESSHHRNNFFTPNDPDVLSPWSSLTQFQSTQVTGNGNMFGAVGMWNNALPFMTQFMSPQFQSNFFGAFGMQSAFQQASALFQNFHRPWRPALPSPYFRPRHPRNQYEPRPWNYHPRPYRRPYKRRMPYNTHYNTTTGFLGEKRFINQSRNTNEVIPLKLENENEHPRQKVKVQVKDEDDDIIECTSVSSTVKTENIFARSSSANRANFNNRRSEDQNNFDRSRKRRFSSIQSGSDPPNKAQGIVSKLRYSTKEENDDSPEKAGDLKTWRDLKHVMQVVVLDSSSDEGDDDDDDTDDDNDYEDDDQDDDEDDDIFVIVDDVPRSERRTNKPLIQPEDCRDIGTVLKKLQIIKSADLEKQKEAVSNTRLRISFDLYLPSASFRKACPGLPNFRISVVGFEDPLPDPAEVVALLKDYEDDVPVLFAIVLPDTVTFLQFGSVELPVELSCP